VREKEIEGKRKRERWGMPECLVTRHSCDKTFLHASRHFTTRQRTATHCSTLQHTTQCNTLQHTARHSCMRQDISLLGNALQHTATHCNTLQHTATHCSTLHHNATQCNTLQDILACVKTFLATRMSTRHSSPLSLFPSPSISLSLTHSLRHSKMSCRKKCLVAQGKDRECELCLVAC